MSDARLPNFSALRAFEAAARHENFSRAAEELHLTHGAISHQVRALERELGLALFERHGKQVRITLQGAQYARQLAKAFADMAAASAALRRSPVHQRLTIAAIPVFAARWLAPRLGGFIERHPAINVVLQTGEQWLADGVDVAIRRADGAYPGWLVEPLKVALGEQEVSPHYPDVRDGYVMLMPAVAEQRAQVQAFRDWLQEQLAQAGA